MLTLKGFLMIQEVVNVKCLDLPSMWWAYSNPSLLILYFLRVVVLF